MGTSNIIPVPRSTSGSIVAAAGGNDNRPASLFGFSYRETSGSAAASFRIRTGGATGTIVMSVSLAPGESAWEDLQPNGIYCRDGIYFELVSGALEGSVWHG